MNRFLQGVRNVVDRLASDPKSYRKVRIVMGNEACDLDSAISAIVYAYFLHKENRYKNYEIVPLLNITSEDLPLKTEVTFYLRLHNISLDNIITRDEEKISLKKLHNAGVLEMTLVDHHTLPVNDQFLIPDVIEVIDHRPQDPSWPWPGIDMTLKPVGSCCTLIGDKILKKCPNLMTDEMSSMLHGPILLDTFNFSPEAKRSTELDKEVIRSLKNIVPIEWKTRFEELLTAKMQISDLNNDQVLRKDLKMIGGLPVCGLPVLVEEFMKRYLVEDSLLKMMKVKDVPAVILMGLTVSCDKVTKDIGVMSTDPLVSAKIVDILKNSDAPSLDLSEKVASQYQFTRVFNQGNISMSRKQIGPLIQIAGHELVMK